MSLKELDHACVKAKIGLETNQNERGGGAEVEDLRIPLFRRR